MVNNGRDDAGKFAPGNPGGPGRPRRHIERDYVAALARVVSPGDWQEVLATTLARAKEGDDRARDFLARRLLGNEPPTLLELAVEEARGITPEDQIEIMAQQAGAKAKSQATIDKLIDRVSDI
jgi:hypothetical protein